MGSVQCESWSGKESYSLTDVMEFEGFTAKGDGWAQDGKDMTEDILGKDLYQVLL